MKEGHNLVSNITVPPLHPLIQEKRADMSSYVDSVIKSFSQKLSGYRDLRLTPSEVSKKCLFHYHHTSVFYIVTVSDFTAAASYNVYFLLLLAV